MKESTFTINHRLKSFMYAFNGIKVLLKEEPNFIIHFILALLAVIISWVLQVSTWEWVAVIFCIAIVWVVEAINTVVENMADFVCPEKNEKIKRIKDVSAAAVLISAIAAMIVGLIIFLPKILLMVV
ncbi:MAG: diacylglycerol kinase family protein [Bacteroidia bacterium]|nr:diacylglycerol kinase family protein [Bacteroidia bacterium]MCZ2249486.1 diacylglycerol kinase family protein [Bacteroidia bacterium]